MNYREKEGQAKELVMAEYQKKIDKKVLYMHLVSAYVDTIEGWIDDTTTVIDFPEDSTDEEDVQLLVEEIKRQISAGLSIFDHSKFTINKNWFATPIEAS